MTSQIRHCIICFVKEDNLDHRNSSNP